MQAEADWRLERSRFPALRAHRYFMTAAVGPLREEVHAACVALLDRLRDEGGKNWPLDLAATESCRAGLAGLISADVADVGLLTNTSQGMNYLAMMLAARSGPGAVVLPADEFPSSSIAWHHHGFEVRTVASRSGRITAEDLLAAATPGTRAVICSAVQFATGFRAPLEEIGATLEARGIPLIVNATQALGAFPLDVRRMRASALLASGHKWLGGGYGCSVFWLAPSFLRGRSLPVAGWTSVVDPAAMRGGPPELRRQPSAAELGVPPFVAHAGVAAACAAAARLGPDAIARRILDLTGALADSLEEDGWQLATPRDAGASVSESCNSGILSLVCADAAAAEHALAGEGVLVTARHGRLRVAVHYFNDAEDLEVLRDALRRLTCRA